MALHALLVLGVPAGLWPCYLGSRREAASQSLGAQQPDRWVSEQPGYGEEKDSRDDCGLLFDLSEILSPRQQKEADEDSMQ